jgi:hypothetical protein
MSLSKLLELDLCPRLRDLLQRKLFLLKPFSVPP